jgi:hypothetical protein
MGGIKRGTVLYNAAKFVSDHLLSKVGLRLVNRSPYVVVAKYTPRKKLKAALSSKYLAETAWPAQADTSPSGGVLFEIWRTKAGGHKWHHYFPVYERYFGPMRDRPIRFLEIGIYRGGSLKMWRDYFHEDAIIVGADIDPACKSFEDVDRKVYCRIGDQADPAFLKSLIEEFGPFDAILDDGSHLRSDMIASFNGLFLNGLQDHGVYMVEDTHCAFWPSYRDQRYSFIDLAKDLVNLQHAHYIAVEGHHNFALGAPTRKAEIEVPRLSRMIAEISFSDSIVTIIKDSARGLPVSQHL